MCAIRTTSVARDRASGKPAGRQSRYSTPCFRPTKLQWPPPRVRHAQSCTAAKQAPEAGCTARQAARTAAAAAALVEVAASTHMGR